MKKNATTPENNKTSELITVLETLKKCNFILDGVNELRIEEIIQTYEVTKLIHSRNRCTLKVISKKLVESNVNSYNFILSEVSIKELRNYRKNNIPSFVLKRNGCLYLTSIPGDINFITSKIIKNHKCTTVHNVCGRLSAASDGQGGCEKVRRLSSCIERYPWITSGYETFNTQCDVFVVDECQHYKEADHLRSFSIEEINRMIISLSNFYFDGEIQHR